MIASELRTRIRRLFFAEHWRVGTIASELGVHHDTVRRAIEADRFIRPDALVRASMLDPYKAFLAETLEQHPRLRATRLFEMARDRGYRGSVVQLRRHVATIRPAPRTEAYLRLQTLPGEQAQVDWGHFGTIRVGHAKRPLSCFVMVLSWSRAIFARFALDQTLDSFLRGHVEAFGALGGVPRTILYDNLKSVVIDRDAVESAVALDFVEKAHNVVLVAPQGLGKTMIAQNIANAAVLAGHSVLFTTAAQLLLDLGAQESARALDQRLRHYCTRTGLLVVDEIGYLSYDNRNADLLFQVVSRRYERKSVVITTNLAFADWPTIFPNAACTTALIDRLVHHSEIISIEGESYRKREAELTKDATAARRRKKRS